MHHKPALSDEGIVNLIPIWFSYRAEIRGCCPLSFFPFSPGSLKSLFLAACSFSLDFWICFPLLAPSFCFLFTSSLSLSSYLCLLSVSLVKTKLDPESLGIILLGPFLLEFFPDQVRVCSSCPEAKQTHTHTHTHKYRAPAKESVCQ